MAGLNNSMNLFFISSVLTAASSFGFGVLVLFRSTNKLLAKRWFLFVSSVALYGVFAALIAVEKNPHRAMLLWWLDYILGVIWISPLFYHFVNHFLGRRAKTSIYFHYAFAFLCVCVTPTHSYFSYTKWMFNSFYYAQGGWFYFIYSGWWWGLVLYTHFLLAQAYKSVTQAKKIKFATSFWRWPLVFPEELFATCQTSE